MNVPRPRGPAYLVVVGAIVGSLLTALSVPLVFGESLRSRGGDVTADGSAFGLTPRETAADPATDEEDGPGTSVATATDGGEEPSGAGGSEAGPTGPGDGGPDDDRRGSPAPPGARLQATDVGVTAEQIRVGYLLLDIGSLSQIGVAVPGVDAEQQKAAFEAWMAETNEAGGINGRELVGVYEKFDVLSQDDMRRACLALRDKEVFAVVAAGGYQGPAVLCVTEEGRTPLVTQGGHGTPTEYMRRSEGRLVTMYPHSDRMMANWVVELDRMEMLEGRRIGIVTQDSVNPGDTVIGGGLIPALREAGYDATHVSRLSSDQSAAASQIPVEVQQMRTKRVDLVLLTASTLASTQFVQTADAQGFLPKYSLTDWASMNNDTSNQNMPNSFDGAVLITTYRTGEEKVGVGENEDERKCREVYERRTGRTLPPKGDNEHGITVSNCTTLDAFLAGAARAGPELTRESFSQGVQAIGTFPMSIWGGGSFGPGKLDAADLVRSAAWFSDCRCIKPTSDFRPSKY